MSAVPYFQSEDNEETARSRMLLISYHFPPSRAAGALRWQKLAKYACGYGWGIDAVALAPADVGRVDPESLADLPAGTRVFGVPEVRLPWEYLERAAWKLYKSLRSVPERMPEALDPGGLVTESFSRRELSGFPRTRQDWRRAYKAWTQYSRERSWARRAASLGLSLVNGTVHRAVITCGPPHMAHEAGRLVSARTGLPFVMDLRDPWSDVERLYEAIASPVWYWVGERHEVRCVRTAALVVMNTEQARRAMVARHPSLADKVITVMNGCDDEPLRHHQAAGPFHVMYAGSVCLDRDPRPLLRAIGMVVRDLHLQPGQFAVDFMGDAASYGGVQIGSLAAAEGLPPQYVHLHGHVPRERLLELLSDAALLVSLPQDSHMAIPSKVFEYMRFPAWLLAFAAPDSATGTLLRASGADLVNPGDADGAASVLRRRYLQYRAGERPEPIGLLQRFTRRHQAHVLFTSLERLFGGSRASRPLAAGVR